MKVIEVEQVIATHRHEWRKWPDTEDKDYAPIFNERSMWYFRRGDTEIRVQCRFYPVYSAYVRSGDLRLPIQFPVINNLCPPSAAVLEQQRKDLVELSKECRAILWEHTHQCFPDVSRDIPMLFPGMRTIIFGDDCPGSSDVKTFPNAAFFSAIVYSMFVWNNDDGSLTADVYRKRGLPYARFMPSGTSSGLLPGLADLGFSISAKLEKIRRGEAKPHLAFVGFTGSGERAQAMNGLRFAHARQKQVGLEMKLYGIGMPDGVLEPRDPPHPKGLAYPMAPLYAEALAGPNMAISSLWNCRAADLFHAGVVQVARDRWGEFRKMGFVDGEHFLDFNGTSDDVLAKVELLRTRPAYAAEIAERAYEKAVVFWKENSWTNAFTDVYFHHFGDEVGREETDVPPASEDVSFVAGCRR